MILSSVVTRGKTEYLYQETDEMIHWQVKLEAELKGVAAHWESEDELSIRITLTVPLSWSSSIDVRFMNSLPNSESMN